MILLNLFTGYSTSFEEKSKTSFVEIKYLEARLLSLNIYEDEPG